MADLNVQPKKRAPLWPWLLLILIIAAVAYFLLRDNDVIPVDNTTDSTHQYRTDTIRTDTVAP